MDTEAAEAALKIAAALWAITIIEEITDDEECRDHAILITIEGCQS